MPQQDSAAASFGITKSGNIYTVAGVTLHNGGICSVELTDDLLAYESSRTPEQWAEYKAAKGLGPGSAPLITDVIAALRDNMRKEGVMQAVLGLRALFSRGIRKKMFTATRLTYRTTDPDIVRHGIDILGQTSLEARLVGADGKLEDDDVARALFGRSARDVNSIYQWLMERGSLYLTRLNQKPDKDIDYVLGLGDFPGAVVVDASGVIGATAPVLGMRIAPTSTPSTVPLSPTAR